MEEFASITHVQPCPAARLAGPNAAHDAAVIGAMEYGRATDQARLRFGSSWNRLIRTQFDIEPIEDDNFGI